MMATNPSVPMIDELIHDFVITTWRLSFTIMSTTVSVQHCNVFREDDRNSDDRGSCNRVGVHVGTQVPHGDFFNAQIGSWLKYEIVGI